MRIDKIYTRGGDDGTTGLVGGKRLPKDCARIESYGTVDELQAVLGVLRAALAEPPERREAAERYVAVIHRIQNDLFDLGSALATPPELSHRVRRPITAEDVRVLEETMDGWLPALPPLRSFVLSGGGRLSSLAQVARTVCRRCERETLRLSREEQVPAEILRYLNRLSDLLFVLGRELARAFGEEEPLWETPLAPKP
ncbi:cob(I)yrinic acid a,c-diamide adenosyltransferase [Haliangium sp.]